MRRRRSPWAVRSQSLLLVVAGVAAALWFGLPAAGLYAGATGLVLLWPPPEEFEPETPAYRRALAAQAYRRPLLWPFARHIVGFGPTGTTVQETAERGWTPATRLSGWAAVWFAGTVTAVGLQLPRHHWAFVLADLPVAFLLWQALCAGARNAAWPGEGSSFPAALLDREHLEQLDQRVLVVQAAAAGAAAAALAAAVQWRIADLLPVEPPSLLWRALVPLWAAVSIAAGVAARRYIHAYNQPLRDHLAAAEAWQRRWMELPKLSVAPPHFYAEHVQPPPEHDLPETHRKVFFMVPPGATTEDYRAKTDQLVSAIDPDPSIADHVLVAPEQQLDDAGTPIPGTRREGAFTVTYNTVPLPAKAHLAGGLDDYTTKFAMHRAFDRALAGLKLGTPDLVRVQPLHDMQTPNALWDTVWQLPADLTYDKLVAKADQIAEKISAPWLRVGRRTTDSQGRPVADGHVSIVYGAPPDQVTFADLAIRPWIDALELERAFHALKLGSPLLVDTTALSMPGSPPLNEARFQLSADIDWTTVAKKTAAVQEKVDADYLRVTRRSQDRGTASPLVSVVYGAHPATTRLIGDPAGYDPTEPKVGEETNDLRLWLDALDWDGWMRASKLVGTDGRSPVLRSKSTNDQQVHTYTFETVPGLAVDVIDARVAELKATSGMAYIEVEEDRNDGQQFQLLAARVDPLEKAYLAVDYLDAPKPGDPYGRPVLHDAEPGKPDIDWVVGPGADGQLLVDRFTSGDLPHLYVGGASGSGKALALDTLIPTPDGWRKMGDLDVGDRLFDENGQPCMVTWVSPTWQDRPCYEVEFDDGTVIVADGEHEWVVSSSAGRQSQARHEAHRPATHPHWGASASERVLGARDGTGRGVTRIELCRELGVNYTQVLAKVIEQTGLQSRPEQRTVRYGDGTRPRTVQVYDRDDLLAALAERLRGSDSPWSRPQVRSEETQTLTTAQLARDLHTPSGARRWSVDVCPGLNTAPRDLPLDPYLVGLLLGDGGFSVERRVTFTTADSELADAVADLLPPSAALTRTDEYGRRIVEVERPTLRLDAWLAELGTNRAGERLRPPRHPDAYEAGKAACATGGPIPAEPCADWWAGLLAAGLRPRRQAGAPAYVSAAAARVIERAPLPHGIELRTANTPYLVNTDPKPPSEFNQTIERLGLGSATSRSKHVPAAYLRGSAEQRLALLQGLMDTDGTISPATGSASFTSVSPQLANDVAELARSLGCKVTVRARTATCNGKQIDAWVASWTSTLPAFRLTRKAKLVPASTTDRVRRRYIRDIRPVPAVETRCIEVDAPSHQFLASEAMVPTHNSISVLLMLLQLLHNNHPSDLKMALIDPKTELRYFRPAEHVNHFLGLDTPGFAANPYGAIADLLAAMQDETYRRNTLFVEHPAVPQNLSQARWFAKQEIEHAEAGTVPAYWPDDGDPFPWWDHEGGEAHPFWMPWQLIVVEECSTFFTTPANKEHREDHARTIGHLEELARISRSAGVHLVLVTQYPKKESFGGSTTTLAQCRRIGMKMNRPGSLITIEEGGLEKIDTPGRGMMSYNKGYRGMRALFVRVPDEKNPDAPNDRDRMFGPVPRRNVAAPGLVSATSPTGPSVTSDAPPDPAGLWAPTAAVGKGPVTADARPPSGSSVPAADRPVQQPPDDSEDDDVARLLAELDI